MKHCPKKNNNRLIVGNPLKVNSTIFIDITLLNLIQEIPQIKEIRLRIFYVISTNTHTRNSENFIENGLIEYY